MQNELFSDTLSEARAVYWGSADRDGSVCPCCERFGRKYRRKLNSGMARSLIWMLGASMRTNGEWVSVQERAPRYVLRSREMEKLESWGLLARRPTEDDEDKRESGDWKITPLGESFARNKAKVISHGVFYNRSMEKFEGYPMSIVDALGKKFSYQELMKEHVGAEWSA